MIMLLQYHIFVCLSPFVCVPSESSLSTVVQEILQKIAAASVTTTLTASFSSSSFF